MGILGRIVKGIAVLGIAAVGSTAVSSCHHIDNHRLHVTYVNVTFRSEGEWVVYGVSGAGLYKRFILSENIPQGFPYSAYSSTGMGGILLCTTYYGVPVAYDLSCPVECSPSVKVFINDENVAECPKCGSRYDVFEKLGYPIAGKAAEDGYGMQVYRVSDGVQGNYKVISL